MMSATRSRVQICFEAFSFILCKVGEALTPRTPVEDAKICKNAKNITLLPQNKAVDGQNSLVHQSHPPRAPKKKGKHPNTGFQGLGFRAYYGGPTIYGNLDLNPKPSSLSSGPERPLGGEKVKEWRPGWSRAQV